MKAKLELHHDDYPCTNKLDGNFCHECQLTPDMQSTCFYYYCPKCNVKLKHMEYPLCNETFETE
jgi:hypothetical protein